MGKSKLAEKRNARILFVEQYKAPKEISALVGVATKTILEWISKDGWMAQRDAYVNSSKKQIQAIREVISSITHRRLDIEKQIKETPPDQKVMIDTLRSESISLGDEVSKWNKTLENLDKSNRVSLEIYLEVMDQIFIDMQKSHPEQFLKLIDFQEQHINHVSQKYS